MFGIIKGHKNKLNTIKNLHYNEAILFYSGLYRWTIGDESVSCSSEDAENKIQNIYKKCKNSFPDIVKILPNSTWNKTEKVELKISKHHISYPIIIEDAINLTTDDKLDLTIKIRLNPCIKNTNVRKNGNLSKVWVIIKPSNKLNLSSDQLVTFFSFLEKKAKEIEKYIAKVYSETNKDNSKIEQIGHIFIRCVSLRPKNSINLQRIYSNLNSKNAINTKFINDEVLRLTSRDLNLLSKQDYLKEDEIKPATADDLAKEILEKNQNFLWKVGGDKTNDIVYRMAVGEKAVGVGGTFLNRNQPEGDKAGHFYRSFQRIAVNFSWML